MVPPSIRGLGPTTAAGSPNDDPSATTAKTNDVNPSATTAETNDVSNEW